MTLTEEVALHFSNPNFFYYCYLESVQEQLGEAEGQGL